MSIPIVAWEVAGAAAGFRELQDADPVEWGGGGEISSTDDIVLFADLAAWGGSSNIDTVAEAAVTAHEAALTILESQITDGALLARVGGNETITGTWGFDETIGGSIDGNAATATLASTVTVADTEAVGCFVGLFSAATGSLAALTDEQLTYVANTGVLTAAGFAGPLTGAVTGNASSATLAATVTVIDSTSETCSVALFDSATGSLAIKTDGGLTYNASTADLAATTFSGALDGNAGTASLLETARTINGVSFTGGANITVTAAAGTLTGTTLKSSVVTSSLTSVGTLADLTVTNPITGSVSGASGSSPAGSLTGATLAAGVTASSLTSLGTIGSLVATTADINGGTIDATTIGATTPAAIAGTTGTFSSTLHSTGDFDCNSKFNVTASTGALQMDGNLIVSGTGPHAFGLVASNAARLKLSGSFTSGGVSVVAAGFFVDGEITGHSGDSSWVVGTFLGNSIVLTGNTADVAQLRILPPLLTLGGSTADNASTLLVTGPPLTGTAKWALRSVSGAWYNGGTLYNSGNVGIGAAAGTNALEVTGAMLCTTGFGCNSKSPQTAAVVGAAATDPATTQALANLLRTALIDNGITKAA